MPFCHLHVITFKGILGHNVTTYFLVRFYVGTRLYLLSHKIKIQRSQFTQLQFNCYLVNDLLKCDS